MLDFRPLRGSDMEILFTGYLQIGSGPATTGLAAASEQKTAKNGSVRRKF